MPVRIINPRVPNILVAEAKSATIKATKMVCANVLQYVGLEAVTEARNHGSYTDQTGNLRSSICDVVTVDGKIYHQGTGIQVGNGSEGVKQGKEYIEEVAKKRDGDIQLHIVAGMDYADYVERIHHKNVLASARVLIDRLVPIRLEQSGIKLTPK